MSTANKWYVVYTKPRWEKKVASLLTEKGYENYCPLNRVTKNWSDRIKIVLEPLFKGYVFVFTEENNFLEVTKTDGILNFVHWLRKPAVVKEKEIITIKKFLMEFEDVKISDNILLPQDRVEIQQGILMNYKGIVLEVNGNIAKVKIDGMGLELTASFNKNNVLKL